MSWTCTQSGLRTPSRVLKLTSAWNCKLFSSVNFSSINCISDSCSSFNTPARSLGFNCKFSLHLRQLTKQKKFKLDPLQFAYRVGCGVVDVTLTLMDKVGKYLDAADCCVRILFMDFSSAFNTVNINILLRRLEKSHAHQTLILWINSFFTGLSTACIGKWQKVGECGFKHRAFHRGVFYHQFYFLFI